MLGCIKFMSGLSSNVKSRIGEIAYMLKWAMMRVCTLKKNAEKRLLRLILYQTDCVFSISPFVEVIITSIRYGLIKLYLLFCFSDDTRDDKIVTTFCTSPEFFVS